MGLENIPVIGQAFSKVWDAVNWRKPQGNATQQLFDALERDQEVPVYLRSADDEALLNSVDGQGCVKTYLMMEEDRGYTSPIVSDDKDGLEL